MKIKLNISDKKFNIFFISDVHFSHANVITHDRRNFLFDKKIGYPKPGDKDKSNLNVELMNETLIKNWNDVVGENDVVFYLGDFCFRGVLNTKEIADQLNGKIHFIIGNHDEYKVISKIDKFESISDYIEIWVQYGKTKQDKIQMCLMHYPITSWNRKHHGSIMLHGHCHGNLMRDNPELYEKNNIIDVSCCMIDYEPIDFWSIKKIIDEK